jgi:hypothetical protein
MGLSHSILILSQIGKPWWDKIRQNLFYADRMSMADVFKWNLRGAAVGSFTFAIYLGVA